MVDLRVQPCSLLQEKKHNFKFMNTLKLSSYLQPANDQKTSKIYFFFFFCIHTFEFGMPALESRSKEIFSIYINIKNSRGNWRLLARNANPT